MTAALKVLHHIPREQLSVSPQCPWIGLCKTGLTCKPGGKQKAFSPNLKPDLTHPVAIKILCLNGLSLTPSSYYHRVLLSECYRLDLLSHVPCQVWEYIPLHSLSQSWCVQSEDKVQQTNMAAYPTHFTLGCKCYQRHEELKSQVLLTRHWLVFYRLILFLPSCLFEKKIKLNCILKGKQSTNQKNGINKYHHN